ncbi:hypothetical protein VTK56DRAFT_4402 [Thermocarpiscus australiensis]
MTKQRQLKTHIISDRIIRLCTSEQSVSSLLAEDPSLAPGDAWERLYGAKTAAAEDSESTGSESPNPDELERAARCGKWGPTTPSELFLRIYHDALCTLDEEPSRAVVSPSLMGSYGVVPLTVISVVPDIVRHMSNVIVRAEREVFLATNYWQNSVASRYITNAIRELDRRAGKRGTKIVLKILYDRGSPKQLFEPHYIVSEKEYTSKNVNLPHPSEIPNIDMQVMNFHTPLMGTFHAKYMVVDRKLAILQSNNIQDNDNLEMLVHLEGPIVDSLYDMALISWHKRMDPPLPSITSPAAKRNCGIRPAGNRSDCETGRIHERGAVDPVPPAESSDRRQADLMTGPSNTGSVNHGPPIWNRLDDEKVNRDVERNGSSVTQVQADEQIQSHLSEGQQRTFQSPIESLPEHTADDPHYDDDIAGEVARIQYGLSPKPGETHMQGVTRLLNHTVNEGLPGDPRAPECPPGELMTPYIPHQARTPYPMALVNRAPCGRPGHESRSTPQNAAWLSALRNAKKSVLIQSPTLNASPLIPAIREACERGVDVHCYVCLSYNDAGELLPFQGGHNERVAADLHRSLSPRARQHLHYCWYVAKDQTAPLAQSRRLRSCHVKLMVVDGRVGIVGNGNQDTQSWFHSQEINLMVDSEELCGEWLAALGRNQNTELFGKVGREDGVWRDGEGREAQGAIGVDAGRLSWVKGVSGAVKRLRGTGGF